MHVKRQLDASEEFVLIDVREQSEWAASRIPKAIHIGKGVLERDIETVVPDTNAPIVLYCGGGFRSAIAAASLRSMRYSRVESMDGGFSGWLDAGHAIIEEER